MNQFDRPLQVTALINDSHQFQRDLLDRAKVDVHRLFLLAYGPVSLITAAIHALSPNCKTIAEIDHPSRCISFRTRGCVGSPKEIAGCAAYVTASDTIREWQGIRPDKVCHR
jgi:hypothetical protein